MSRSTFARKLLLFLVPLAALFGLPLFVMWRSREILPVGMLAKKHRAAKDPNAIFGPAYTNPDKGFKMASLCVRNVPVAALGTSRVMQFRAWFFRGVEDVFYNAGGVVTRIGDYRRVLRRLVTGAPGTRQLLVGVDPWMFNGHWAEVHDDPGVEREYDGDYSSLDGIQRSLRTYPDLHSGKMHIGDFLRDTESMGVNGMSHGNGFRRDGSYAYADLLRDPKTGEDYQFRDTLDRMDLGVRRFEPADEPLAASLDEVSLILAEATKSGFHVVLFLPPFAPTIWGRMVSDAKWRYVRSLAGLLRQRAEAGGASFFDFSACGRVGCRDEDFIDGFHGGATVYARMLLEMSETVPWLADQVDRVRVESAISAATTWEL